MRFLILFICLLFNTNSAQSQPNETSQQSNTKEIKAIVGGTLINGLGSPPIQPFNCCWLV